MSEIQPYRLQCYVAALADAEAVNRSIVDEYTGVRDDPGLVRTHFFGGRYENIYVPGERLPTLKPVLAAARRLAAGYLQQPHLDLSVGFWFNEMGPGHATLPHSHDDDDERVSGVYYISAPENSGDLILRQGVIEARVTPVAGQFVFFSPEVVHEVSENHSGQLRLSIGMNFGTRD